tara:strand:- start:439 stop:2778 length:2340 start_codon:yes stop_codon:yes gene_type:complete
MSLYNNKTMTKLYLLKPTLVLVESPAKCSKIQQYLGDKYKVLASYGHFRELSSLTDVDFEQNLKLTFKVIDNHFKKKQLALIRKTIDECDEVILASDSDREGEAIAWHICDFFKLDVAKCKRIIFNEVTETAIQYAINHPIKIDLALVQAQQTRQVLDLLVGFRISPVLWKFVTGNKSLSAGRCQTPALKLIYDNQIDINNNLTQERKIYNTSGYFTNSNICFDLNKEFETESEITQFLNATIDFEHKYVCSKPVKVYKPAPEPLTTSKVQQMISNECRYSPKETMQICQSLYEAGYITYMRTDSKAYSKEFIDTITSYIGRTYDETFLRKDLVDFIVNVNTSGAHEAMRPTDISLKELSPDLNIRERRVYKIIRDHTLESCMSSACVSSVHASITGANTTLFEKNSELLVFPGWKIVKGKNGLTNKEYQYLILIKDNTVLRYNNITAQENIKNVKQHYTEAKVIQLLEERGIGRPSTFAMLVDKIQERGYVKKTDIKGREVLCKEYSLVESTIVETVTKKEFGNEKRKLVMQPLGNSVIAFLVKHFSGLFNYEYTKHMEEELDKITCGTRNGHELCKDCNELIEGLISTLKQDKKLEFVVDENNTYIVGKYGPVIKCIESIDNVETIKYKSIKSDIDMMKLEQGDYKVEDLISENKSILVGKYLSSNVFIQNGKYGLYAVWGKNKKTLKDLGNREASTVTLEEIIPYLESGVTNIVRVLSKEISIRTGPKGDYIFFKSKQMRKPKFYDIKQFNMTTDHDYKVCNIDILMRWLDQVYKI